MCEVQPRGDNIWILKAKVKGVTAVGKSLLSMKEKHQQPGVIFGEEHQNQIACLLKSFLIFLL